MFLEDVMAEIEALMSALREYTNTTQDTNDNRQVNNQVIFYADREIVQVSKDPDIIRDVEALQNVIRVEADFNRFLQDKYRNAKEVKDSNPAAETLARRMKVGERVIEVTEAEKQTANLLAQVRKQQDEAFKQHVASQLDPSWIKGIAAAAPAPARDVESIIIGAVHDKIVADQLLKAKDKETAQTAYPEYKGRGGISRDDDFTIEDYRRGFRINKNGLVQRVPQGLYSQSTGLQSQSTIAGDTPQIFIGDVYDADPNPEHGFTPAASAPASQPASRPVTLPASKKSGGR